MTIGEIEKKYGVDFHVNSRMKLSTWLKKSGFKNLAHALRFIEKVKKPSKSSKQSLTI